MSQQVAPMTEVSCIDAGPGDREAWDAFIASSPHAALGHLFGWKQVFERAYRKRTHYLMASRDGTVVGALPLVRMGGPLGGNRLVSLPFLDHAGILAADAKVAMALEAEALAIARRLGARGIELRSVARAETGETAATGRATLILDLPPTAEEIWKSFSTKVRNQVRKAEKEGLRTEAAPRERLREFYRVFAVNMRDLGSPVHSLAFLEAVLDAFPSEASLYLTSGGGRVVGGAIALASAGTVTVPWASSLREAFPSCPNHSLYWKILGDSIARGAGAFDFGRSHLDSGTYRFKVQWGARPVPLEWSTVGRNGVRAPAGALKPQDHGWLTSAWQKLPLWIASRLGPLLRGHIPN